MTISGNTKINDLLKAYPFLEDFLVAFNPRFEMLKNRVARATVGRVATLRTVSGIANIDLGSFIAAIAAEIESKTGTRPAIEAVAEPATVNDRNDKIGILKSIIQGLHDGGDLEQARQRFSEAVHDVEASEIAAMEEELIKGGLPVSEVQRLCDVHVGAFRQALDGHAVIETPPGHPVHTYMAANRRITELADRLGVLAREIGQGRDLGNDFRQARLALEGLTGLENHYQRKENQIFPFLERHGITGPSKVMWGVHDQIRAKLKSIREAANADNAATFAAEAPAVSRDIIEMIYKEEKILFPMALETLSAAEWAEIRRGEDELGYILAKPAALWPTDTELANINDTGATDLLPLKTGAITLEQVNLIMTHLPLDLSFVDETDTVQYYSEGPERIFPRSPGVIGRKVQNCHPPKSVHMVQEILDAFRAGRQNTAEFWIQMRGRFVHIRYLAIRDEGGTYRGCLEVSQDVTGIRALSGEQRLLQWRPEPTASS